MPDPAFACIARAKLLWQDYGLEDVIGDSPSHVNAFRFVEGPMNPEIDPAMPVLFLGLR
jgi:hypothetical protein